MRVPSQRDADRRRRRARVDEQLAMLRVIHARLRRRSAEATIEVLGHFESARRRIESANSLVVSRIGELSEKTRRFWRRDGDR